VLPADLIPRKKYGARTEAIGKRHIEKAPPLFSTDIINRLYPFWGEQFLLM
jgi:hypothetical protein